MSRLSSDVTNDHHEEPSMNQPTTLRPLLITLIGSIITLSAISSSFAEETKPAPTSTETPPLVQPSEIKKEGDTVRLPGLTVHAVAEPYVEATGKLALTEGILEFVAVETTGRTYESLVGLECKPSALQFALLLIGCEPSPNPKEHDPKGKMGDRLDIELEWNVNDKVTRMPIDQLMINRSTGKPPTDLAWYFTGSNFIKTMDGKRVFYADMDQSFIALIWMPGVLINLGNDLGNPYEGANSGLEVHTKRVPPVGTPVKMIFRKHKAK
jgi:hypothetical protein